MSAVQMEKTLICGSFQNGFTKMCIRDRTSAKNDQIHRFAEALGADEAMLREFMQLRVTEANINEFGRFDKLKATVNRDDAKAFLEALEGSTIKPFQINMKVDQILRKFILEGGFDI